MEILKIKLNEKQPIAQQLYLTEESDYGLAIQIDGLQSQGPESITFNGSQLTSEKDKVADYNLFKIKTPKYDKTQNKYLIEIPDIDGSVTYKITVNIIQSETVYQDNGNGNSELPAWTENIEGTADTLCINKYGIRLATYDLVANYFGSSDPALSVGSTSTYIKRGQNGFIVSNDDSIGVYLYNNTSDFSINRNGANIHSESDNIGIGTYRGDIQLSSTTGNINIIAKGNSGGLRADVNSICIFDRTNNLILSAGQDTTTSIAGGTTGNKSSINIGNSINLNSNNDINVGAGCGTVNINSGSGISACAGTSVVSLNNQSFCVKTGCDYGLILNNNYSKLKAPNDPNSYICVSNNIELKSNNIETAGCNLFIKNNNIIAYNNCTAVTNAQLSYLFQIAQKLTPENLPSVLEILGLNT